MQSTKRRHYFLYVPTSPHHLCSKSVHGLLILEFVSQFHASATVWFGVISPTSLLSTEKVDPPKADPPILPNYVSTPLSIHKLEETIMLHGVLASNFGLGVKNIKTTSLRKLMLSL